MFLMRFRRLVQGLGLAVVIAVTGGQAVAADLDIKAFEGHWQGTGVSESAVSVSFQFTARDLDVVIRPSSEGFTLVSTTVQRKKGDPANPDEVQKSTEFNFVSSGFPNVWHLPSNKDPENPGFYVWARIKDTTLTVTALYIGVDGRSDFQVFERTLSGPGMALEFRRMLDGKLARTVKGKLIKVGK